jgi:plastocyanin
VHVQAAGSSYPKTQAQYDKAAHVTGKLLIAAGHALTGITRGATHSSGRTQVALGTGASLGAFGSLAIMRFLPSKTVIHAGGTVHWTNLDPETPHTVTFGVEPGGGPLGAFAPSGSAVPGHATLSSPTDSANSGFVGAGLPFGTTFSATFTAPGTYNYICALHDDLGMTGTVVVLP